MMTLKLILVTLSLFTQLSILGQENNTNKIELRTLEKNTQQSSPKKNLYIHVDVYFLVEDSLDVSNLQQITVNKEILHNDLFDFFNCLVSNTSIIYTFNTYSDGFRIHFDLMAEDSSNAKTIIRMIELFMPTGTSLRLETSIPLNISYDPSQNPYHDNILLPREYISRLQEESINFKEYDNCILVSLSQAKCFLLKLSPQELQAIFLFYVKPAGLIKSQ